MLLVVVYSNPLRNARFLLALQLMVALPRRLTPTTLHYR